MTDNDAKNVDVLNMTIVCRLVAIGKNIIISFFTYDFYDSSFGIKTAHSLNTLCIKQDEG